MKVKNYEKMIFMYIFIVFIIFMELIFCIILFNKKQYNYVLLSGVVVKDDVVILIVSKEERKMLYQNRYLYIDDYRKKFNIIEDNGVLVNDYKKGYYEILIKSKINNKYKDNDVVSISIKNKKYRLINVFKLIWDGDKNDDY